ncbi:MAG: hypothetical protein CBC42_02670 [Betaproteobacteria bacterium TMED82]|nr:MAG: hypothetical protein CBC42_02670 [Betaproteobacteria bacterium TMED82]
MTAISRAIQIVIFAIIAIFLFLIFNLSVGFSFVLGLCISYLGSLLSYAHFLILQKLRFNAFFLVGLFFGEMIKAIVILIGLSLASHYYQDFYWLSAIVGIVFGLFFFMLLHGIPRVLNIAKIEQFMHNSTCAIFFSSILKSRILSLFNLYYC